MANLSEICEELFWIFFEEELCNFWVLQAARSAGWWHPAGQLADRLSGFKVLPQPLVHLYEWSLFSMDYCKKKIAILHWLSSSQSQKQSQQWSSFHVFQSKHPCCVKQYNLSAEIMSQSHCDTSEAFLQNTNQSQNTKRDTFLAPASAQSPAEQSTESLWPTAINRLSLVSPYHLDTLPLRSYTHYVLKYCSDFVKWMTQLHISWSLQDKICGTSMMYMNHHCRLLICIYIFLILLSIFFFCNCTSVKKQPVINFYSFQHAHGDLSKASPSTSK